MRARSERRVWAVWALALWLAMPGVAWAQDGGPAEADDARVVGVYAPRLLFASGMARSRYAADVAAALSAATGLAFKGRGFATGREFDSQVATGRVAVALVDAQVQARRSLTPLGQARRNGKAAAPMVLVVAPGVQVDGLLALKGRSLATVPVGPGDAGFRANFLLQGEVGDDFFSLGRSARDVQGALNLVSLGKADAAFTFAGDTAGLRVVFRSRPVPLPVWVQTDPSLTAAQVAQIRQALAGLRVAGPVQGVGPADGPALAGLAKALGAPRRRVARPILGTAPDDLPPLAAHPAAPRPVGVAGAVPVADALGVPAPPADAF